MREHIDNLKVILNQVSGVKDFEQVKEIFQNIINEVQLMDTELLSHEDMMDSYINENKEYKEKIIELQDTIRSNEDSLLASRNIQKTLEEEKEELEKHCIELEKQSAELEGKIHIETENNTPLVKEIFKSLQRIETGVSKINNKVDSNTDGLKNVVSATNTLDKSISVLIDTKEKVQEITEVYQETINDFREDINEQDNKIIDIQDKLEDVAEDVEIVKDSSESLYIQVDDIEKDCDENTKFISKLKGLFSK